MIVELSLPRRVCVCLWVIQIEEGDLKDAFYINYLDALGAGANRQDTARGEYSCLIWQPGHVYHWKIARRQRTHRTISLTLS